ncbi:MAG TPA: DUF5020 domain-containing protein [Candidatus Marinimicrobia bacterium]|nr:DUF5020 domain-containing protein [Candidatus Neomarinimicrobiota bacterium]
MRKHLIWILLLLSVSVFGQNLQVHYDFGEDRSYVTSTLEMFRPDNFGATFWFVDIDYNSSSNSASMAYWEIARYINLPFLKNAGALQKLSATIQYNDGLNTFGGFGSVWLAGVSYPIDLKVVTIATDVLYRKAENQESNFQLTFVWYKSFLNDKISFTGFFDIWGQDNFDGDEDGTNSQIVFMTEPQLWVNLTDHLSIGGEVEISRNFIFAAGDKIQVMPTLGLKWDF